MLKPKILAWFSERKTDAMNFLQDAGLVSDNAITLDDVCTHDIGLVHYFILSREMERLFNLSNPQATLNQTPS